MTHQVQYKVGKELFSPSRYSGGEHLIAVVTKIGTKYVQAVNKKYHGTEDEKEMTFKIERDTHKRVDGMGGFYMYESEAQYEAIIATQTAQRLKKERLQEIPKMQLTPDQIDRILAIVDEGKA